MWGSTDRDILPDLTPSSWTAVLWGTIFLLTFILCTSDAGTWTRDWNLYSSIRRRYTQESKWHDKLYSILTGSACRLDGGLRYKTQNVY